MHCKQDEISVTKNFTHTFNIFFIILILFYIVSSDSECYPIAEFCEFVS